MSEYTFGYDENDPNAGVPGENNGEQQGPKWFREGLAKLSGQVNELKAENDRLKAAQRRDEVANALKAKGFAPQAAGLYQGEPEKLDDWLKANGEALAKLPGEGSGEQEAETTTSAVPADQQDQMRRMQEAGTSGAAASEGSDKELANSIRAAQSMSDFAEIMRANGSTHDWS